MNILIFHGVVLPERAQIYLEFSDEFVFHDSFKKTKIGNYSIMAGNPW
ncbi:MAG: hypothetical protein HQL87_17675 [Magnetococcales bacterium]|nr:hypothetical protein [Magnetococcales bacterium]